MCNINVKFNKLHTCIVDVEKCFIFKKRIKKDNRNYPTFFKVFFSALLKSSLNFIKNLSFSFIKKPSN